MLLIIDNHDSFTYNLAHYCQQLQQDVVVKKNNAISVSDIKQLQPDYILISPGPCTPDDAGISLQVIEYFAEYIPILGVCMGHQCIAQHFGAKIIRASKLMHGKNSLIYHNGDGLFQNILSPLSATRYHSLIVDPETLPSCLETTAWAEQDGQKIIMGLKHTSLPIQSVQFHPEAWLTEHGLSLLENFFVINKGIAKKNRASYFS